MVVRPLQSKVSAMLANGVFGLALVLSLLNPAPMATAAPLEESKGFRITLLQLNDVYQYLPIQDGARGGLARVATLSKQIEQESPHTFFVLAGDTLSPSLASRIYKGRQMIDMWNLLGIDYATLGNHEFDFGPDVLKTRMAESHFPWLAANVRDRKTGRAFENMPDYIIKPVTLPNKKILKIGFFGLLTPDTAKSSIPGPDVIIEDPIQTADRMVRQLRAKGATVIVAVTHLPMSQDKELAQRFPIDIILGGHEHVLLQSLVGKTPIFKVASDAQNLGRVDLTIDIQKKRVASMDWDIIPVVPGIADDPAIMSHIQQYETDLNEKLGQSVGRTAVNLDARQSANRSGETNLGDFLADTYRQQTGADAALINGGSIRSDKLYPPGTLSRRDILSILPFDNKVVKLSLSGSALKEALENGVSETGESGRFPHISGMRFTYDPERPAGSRILEVTIHGQPLADTQTYTLATTSFLQRGGDNYAMFPKGKLLIPTDSAKPESELLEESLRATPEIAPQVDGRIQIK